MNREEIKETPIWGLYEKGRNYHRMTGIYVDTDRNYRMYNGNQWDGAKLGDVEPVQKNFIKPIALKGFSVGVAIVSPLEDACPTFAPIKKQATLNAPATSNVNAVFMLPPKRQ